MTLRPHILCARTACAHATSLACVLSFVVVLMTCPALSTARTTGDAKFSISGIVVDANGAPASGIDVTLVQPALDSKGVGAHELKPGESPTGDSTSIGRVPAVGLQQGKGRNDKVLKETKTDSAGRFSFDGLENGTFAVVAISGEKKARVKFVVAGSNPPSLTLKLVKG